MQVNSEIALFGHKGIVNIKVALWMEFAQSESDYAATETGYCDG